MNKLQRMISFAERYNLAWDDPDFDGIYNYISSIHIDRSFKVEQSRGDATALGGRSLFNRKFKELYAEYYKDGEIEAAEKGLVGGYAEDHADGYAVDYARYGAYNHVKRCANLIPQMISGGISKNVICDILDLSEEEIDALIAKVQSEH